MVSVIDPVWVWNMCTFWPSHSTWPSCISQVSRKSTKATQWEKDDTMKIEKSWKLPKKSIQNLTRIGKANRESYTIWRVDVYEYIGGGWQPLGLLSFSDGCCRLRRLIDQFNKSPGNQCWGGHNKCVRCNLLCQKSVVVHGCWWNAPNLPV